MSAPINDGGPAFPQSLAFTEGQPHVTGEYFDATGMSLRDWFAGQALAGMWANPARGYSPAGYAVTAYRQADAMISARTATVSTFDIDAFLRGEGA